MSSQSSATPVRLAYVGCVVPGRPEYYEGNYSHAANMWQMNAINTLADHQLAPAIILSQRRTSSHQQSGIRAVPPRSDVLDNGMMVKLAPFINLPILRQLSVGFVVLYYLLLWGMAKEQRGARKIVFSYNLLEPPGIFTWLAGKLIGATTVCCINDINVIGDTFSDTLMFRIANRLEKAVSLYDGIIVITDAIAQDFAPGRHYLRVPGAVDTAILDRFERVRKVQAGKTTFDIVTTGNLSRLNGFEEIIVGFMQTTNPAYRLRIAGPGALQPLVEQAAELDRRIEYCGVLSFDEVLALYESADCILNMRLTKRYNTRYFFPSKLFEFMASGVPVITTCPGHVASEWSDIAVLLHQETPDELASAIDYVAGLTPQQRYELGRAASRSMRQHYTWEVMGSQMADYILATVAAREEGASCAG